MALPAPTYRYSCEIRKIVDGDTLEVDVSLGFHAWLRSVKIRLRGINCPEIDTDAGKDAKRFVVDMLMPGLVALPLVIDSIKADKYGNRWDAIVWLPDGRNLNDVLVASGHAVPMRGESDPVLGSA